MFCQDLSELQQYKICSGNNVYNSRLQKAMEIRPKAGLA